MRLTGRIIYSDIQRSILKSVLDAASENEALKIAKLRKMHRSGEKKVCRRDKKRERGVAAVPSQMYKWEWQSSAFATKKTEKEGGREGRRDGLTRISVPWNPNLKLTTHTFNSHIWRTESSAQGVLPSTYFNQSVRVSLERAFSRWRLPFLILTCADQLIEDTFSEPCQHQDFFFFSPGMLLPHLPVEMIDLLLSLRWGKKGVRENFRQNSPKTLRGSVLCTQIRGSWFGACGGRSSYVLFCVFVPLWAYARNFIRLGIDPGTLKPLHPPGHAWRWDDVCQLVFVLTAGDNHSQGHAWL